MAWRDACRPSAPPRRGSARVGRAPRAAVRSCESGGVASKAPPKADSEVHLVELLLVDLLDLAAGRRRVYANTTL